LLSTLGGARQDIIASADTQTLEKAKRLYAEGKYADSYNFILELWQNPGNRNNPEIIDLKGKCERRLGI
jgi:hypothetical protein